MLHAIYLYDVVGTYACMYKVFLHPIYEIRLYALSSHSPFQNFLQVFVAVTLSFIAVLKNAVAFNAIVVRFLCNLKSHAFLLK